MFLKNMFPITAASVHQPGQPYSTQEHRRNSVSSVASAARMSVTGGAVPKNAKRSASLVRKVTAAATSAASKKQSGASLSKSATATMMHHMKSSLSSSASSEKITVVESSPSASRQGSADSGIGKEEPVREADDEKFALPPRITTYSE